MLFSTVSPAGLANTSALRILGPGHAGRSATLRTGSALAQDAGLVWQEAAANTPRFHAAARRLLVEGERQNMLRNPRGEGGALNTSLALPTYWSPLGTEQVDRQIVGMGQEDGLPYVDIRFSGKAQASSSGFYLLFESSSAIVAAQGETWTASAFVRVAAGSLGSAVPALVLSERTATGGYIATGSGDTLSAGAGRLGAKRLTYTRMLSGTGTARLVPGLSLTFGTNEVVDLTLRFGVPQLERAPFASSPILPPAGAPGAATRAADAVSWAPPGGFTGAGTLVFRAMLPQAAAFGSSQGLVQIDDGTDQNRLLVRNTSGGATVYGVADSGGTNLATLSGGNLTAGQPFRAALAWSAGGIAFCLSGGAVQTAAVAPPGNLARLLIGHASGALDRAAHGEIELIDYRPARLSDAMLQAATAAG